MKKLSKSLKCAVADIQYYCEIRVGHGNYNPGVYSFTVDPNLGMWGKQSRLVQQSDYVWKETEHGVFWMKNRTSGRIPEKLEDNELKDFMWTKLQARPVDA